MSITPVASPVSAAAPALLAHYAVCIVSDDVILVRSARRHLRLEAPGFAAFVKHAVPLLDGRRTIDEVRRSVCPPVDPTAFDQCAERLREAGILASEAPAGQAPPERFTPQRCFFHELSGSPNDIQQRLREATVSILGAGCSAPYAAMALAAAGVGKIRCADNSLVSDADLSLTPWFSTADVGALRTTALSARIQANAPEVSFEALSVPLDSEEQIYGVISGSSFVVCCLDPGLSSAIYKLNRVCLTHGIKWTSGTCSAWEAVLGPTIYPHETACYLCYKMRLVACTEAPGEEFTFERWLDQRKMDDSGRRENLATSTGFLGNLLALEALKHLSGTLLPSARGRIVVTDLVSLDTSKHTVLRKPWCPDCFPGVAELPA